jgi:hypothetical protein
MIISDWWYAIKVCRKYGIKWNPFRKLDNASYYMEFGLDKKVVKSKIHMSPFYPNFLTVFMHEVGHCSLHRRGATDRLYSCAEVNRKYEHESLWHRGKLLLPLLVEESLASRFSRKALKQKANVEYLVKAFQTYSSVGYSEFLSTTPEDARTITRLTDVVEKGIRRIEK